MDIVHCSERGGAKLEHGHQFNHWSTETYRDGIDNGTKMSPASSAVEARLTNQCSIALRCVPMNRLPFNRFNIPMV